MASQAHLDYVPRSRRSLTRTEVPEVEGLRRAGDVVAVPERTFSCRFLQSGGADAGARGGEVLGADCSLALLVESVKGVDVGFDSESVGWRLGDAVKHGFVRVGREPIEEISLLLIG